MFNDGFRMILMLFGHYVGVSDDLNFLSATPKLSSATPQFPWRHTLSLAPHKNSKIGYVAPRNLDVALKIVSHGTLQVGSACNRQTDSGDSYDVSEIHNYCQDTFLRLITTSGQMRRRRKTTRKRKKKRKRKMKKASLRKKP